MFIHQVDKDVAVAKERFGLSASYNAMSPLVLYQGYTRRFLDGKVREEKPARWRCKVHQTPGTRPYAPSRTHRAL